MLIKVVSGSIVKEGGNVFFWSRPYDFFGGARGGGGGAVSVISEKNVLQTDFEPNKKSCKEIPVMQWLSMSYHMETLNKTSFTRVT